MLFISRSYFSNRNYLSAFSFLSVLEIIGIVNRSILMVLWNYHVITCGPGFFLWRVYLPQIILRVLLLTMLWDQFWRKLGDYIRCHRPNPVYHVKSKCPSYLLVTNFLPIVLILRPQAYVFSRLCLLFQYSCLKFNYSSILLHVIQALGVASK